jgi:hypothetical protein
VLPLGILRSRFHVYGNDEANRLLPRRNGVMRRFAVARFADQVFVLQLVLFGVFVGLRLDFWGGRFFLLRFASSLPGGFFASRASATTAAAAFRTSRFSFVGIGLRDFFADSRLFRFGRLVEFRFNRSLAFRRRFAISLACGAFFAPRSTAASTAAASATARVVRSLFSRASLRELALGTRFFRLAFHVLAADFRNELFRRAQRLKRRRNLLLESRRFDD